MRQYRHKPKHALYGVTAGAASLVTSVASGFEGLAVSLNHLNAFLQFNVDPLIFCFRRNLSKELNLEEPQDSSLESEKDWSGKDPISEVSLSSR